LVRQPFELGAEPCQACLFPASHARTSPR
jgi:hypothetical protein